MKRTLVIQAGGESRRMGQNKALMSFRGQPLIARVLSRLSPLVSETLIVANTPGEFEFLDLPVHADVFPGAGALGGLYTALQAASHPYVAVVACDMPFASPALLSAQFDLLEQEGADVVLPSSPEGLEPLHAVYRRAPCLEAVGRALEAGQRRMISFHPDVKVRVMPFEEVEQYDPVARIFININTPDEFTRAEVLAGRED